MNNPFQMALKWVADKFRKDASKMLIWTGVAGWTLSSMAQVAAILFNPKISNEQKSFLVPQEMADAAVNIASFFLITQFAKKTVAKMFSTGKFASTNVRNYLNKANLKDRIGKLDFDLDDYRKLHPDFPTESYWAVKNFGTAMATVGAGIISSNIVTPVIRNKMANKMHKNYLNYNKEKTNKPAENIKTSPVFKSTYYPTSHNLKI